MKARKIRIVVEVKLSFNEEEITTEKDVKSEISGVRANLHNQLFRNFQGYRINATMVEKTKVLGKLK